MKLLFLFLLPVFMAAQDHEVYFDLSADANKFSGVIDNPRTEVDHRGLDWDLEVGLITDSLKWYIYYGEFRAINWTNYGSGLDFYIEKGDWYDVVAGLQVNFISHPFEVYNEDGSFAFYADYNASSLGVGARLAGVFWVFRNVGLSGRLQYVTRPDLEETFGIIEGSIGLTYKL